MFSHTEDVRLLLVNHTPPSCRSGKVEPGRSPTGPKGTLLTSVDEESDDDGGASDASDDAPPPPPNPGPASPADADAGRRTPGALGADGLRPDALQEVDVHLPDLRRHEARVRRVARAEAVWCPLSRDIADASARLGLGTLHEVQKQHPRDWANPGRARVQLRRNGRLVNERIITSAYPRFLLFEAVGIEMMTRPCARKTAPGGDRVIQYS
ncbi:hypothetical protein DFH11DRAFT_1542773 [Phellopilus nigrolimitatus]|nr:hypothetical protein DFH11DRAFT_1542773 [Phellopilus nigrolimitatus]